MRRQRHILGVIAAMALLMSVFTTGAVADPESSFGWYYAEGEQVYDYGDALPTVTRTVEAWVGIDGRYRVVVASPDGTTEEFLYDGETALMAATPPGETEPLYLNVRANPYLWATDGHPALAAFERPQAFTDEIVRDPASELPTGVQHTGEKGSSYELSLVWVSIKPDESLLMPSKAAQALIAQGVEKGGQPPESPGSGATRAVNSRSQTFYDNLYSQGPCVYAKNYRDAEDSYLRAYSLVKGECEMIGVTLRHGSQKQGGGGYCQYTGYLMGGTHASYKNFATYSAWNTPTCTSHAGWYDGLLVVPYLGLDTYPWND